MNGECICINYKLSNDHIFNDGICHANEFVITKNINEEIILGILFITQIKPYISDFESIKTLSLEESKFLHKQTAFKINQICFLKEDIKFKKIDQIFKTPRMVAKIANLQKKKLKMKFA